MCQLEIEKYIQGSPTSMPLGDMPGMGIAWEDGITKPTGKLRGSVNNSWMETLEHVEWFLHRDEAGAKHINAPGQTAKGIGGKDRDRGIELDYRKRRSVLQSKLNLHVMGYWVEKIATHCSAGNSSCEHYLFVQYEGEPIKFAEISPYYYFHVYSCISKKHCRLMQIKGNVNTWTTFFFSCVYAAHTHTSVTIGFMPVERFTSACELGKYDAVHWLLREGARRKLLSKQCFANDDLNGTWTALETALGTGENSVEH